MKFTVLFCNILVVSFISAELQFKYHKNHEIKEFLFNFVQRFPNISQVYSIGQSVKGYDLTVLKITTTNDDLAPNVKLIGNIHGNEAIGREILLQFIEYLGEQHSKNATIARLLNTTILHILPTLNPDGFKISNIGQCIGMKGRNNANNVDLNRNFPDYYQPVKLTEQPESTAIKKWFSNFTFSLSASLHSGALVVNYPFDSPKEQVSRPVSIESPTPDDDVFHYLATVYARNHPRMNNGSLCNNHSFANGITNGAKWYEVIGGMQDYNYAFWGTMELTLELSCCKYPMTREIEDIWMENQNALVEFSFQASRGLRGIIKDYNQRQDEILSLQIAKRNISFYPDNKGRFWRILLSGKYILQVLSNGKIIKTKEFKVMNNDVTTIHLEIFNKEMGPENMLDNNTTSTTIRNNVTTTDKAELFNLEQDISTHPSESKIEIPNKSSSGESIKVNRKLLYLVLLIYIATVAKFQINYQQFPNV